MSLKSPIPKRRVIERKNAKAIEININPTLELLVLKRSVEAKRIVRILGIF
jgi:hypothetical protein